MTTHSTTPHGSHAIVRGVPETLDRCVRTFSRTEKISVELAKKQHEAYCRALEERNLRLTRVPADNSFPDCVFVEDPAIVYKNKAIICNMGAKSRKGEIDEVRKTLSSCIKTVVNIRPPATIEGGDVMKVGDELFVGLSPRTNINGVNQLSEILKDEDCSVKPVKLRNILHLKSACTYLGEDCILFSPGYCDPAVFSSYKLICVPKKEAYAANSLAINGTVFISRGYQDTKRLIEKEGFITEELDVTEFKKCEGSLTCLSIVF